ncbi:MAG TPA: dethiobiotin synthase [Solirubrobacteraceae bacterium]|jgi:dethiobiotin synthetase|nr:dethiobiotin synthase [Solirubrobacteraceae bacterium]
MPPESAVRGLFVTGTGTGVGKSVLSAALLAAIAAAGEPVRAHKPVVTGLDEPPGEWPPDHELLARLAGKAPTEVADMSPAEVTGMAPTEVAPLRYGPAVSPHLAAELAGERIDPERVVTSALAALRDAEERGSALIVEGVGGLLVPLAERFTVRDLAARLGLPLLVAASPGLGTINHTLLTVEAARAAGLDVRAVVLTPWPDRPAPMERSNRDTIARLGDVEVATLTHVSTPEPSALGSAGERLPWRGWLAAERSVPSRA